MKRLLILFFLLSPISLFVLSCASNGTKNNGRAATDDDIKVMFDPDYRFSYYANGRICVDKLSEINGKNPKLCNQLPFSLHGTSISPAPVGEVLGSLQKKF